MTQPHTRDAVSMQESKVPRKDWILLPLISICTIALLAISFVWMASWLNPSSEAGLEGCFAKNSPAARATPNSVCSERIVESRYVAQYKFNSCGHRAGMECGSKPTGAYRIVMIGSSMAMGFAVPREMTFAALLPAELSAETGRKIELYNEATGGEFRGGSYPTMSSPQHFNEVLSEDPDMILWIVTSADINNVSVDRPTQTLQAAAPVTSQTTVQENRLVAAWERARVVIANGTFIDYLRSRWELSVASLVLNHLLYRSESQDRYIKSYLENEDSASFLRAVPGTKWQHSLDLFEVCAAQMEQQANAAGVPLVAVFVPNRAQAAMVSLGKWPTGYDPYKLDDELRTFIVSHGGNYIDIMPSFRSVPNPEQHYFPVDGHPDADGHAMISRFLAKALTSGEVPALRSVAAPQIVVAKGG